MNILVFNCGSSSQGFTVFHRNEHADPDVLISGKARNVATKTKAGGVLEWVVDGVTNGIETDLSSHAIAAEKIIGILKDYEVRIDAVGHRFVNGGRYFRRTALLDADALEKLRLCMPLAPIHNPNSYSVIEVCQKQLPGVPQYAVFDTAFHAFLPAENTAYAIPQQDAEANGWHKIGFHGLSYQYVSKRAAVLLGKPLDQVKLIMCHLGTGGASVCAFRDGHSVDTSMGCSTAAGLVMSTRCGDIDPGIVLDMIRKGWTPDQVSAYLTRESGLIGLSAYSSNLGEIIEAAEQGNKACELAFNVYVNRLRHYIGAYLYELNGADALIFTDDAGIKFAKMREAACRNGGFLGLKLDLDKNYAYDKKSEACISSADSQVQIWVIPTNEELTIYNELAGNGEELEIREK